MHDFQTYRICLVSLIVFVYIYVENINWIVKMDLKWKKNLTPCQRWRAGGKRDLWDLCFFGASVWHIMSGCHENFSPWMILVPFGKKLFPKEKEPFSVQNLVACLVGDGFFFLSFFLWLLFCLLFVGLTGCSRLVSEVYLVKTDRIQLREVVLYLSCNLTIYLVGKSSPLVVC